MTAPLAWLDVSAGVAGDMLLGALIDAGARLGAIQSCLDAVLTGSVQLSAEAVTRAGLRATKVHVIAADERPAPRDWAAIRRLLEGADCADHVRHNALAVFARLAEAEAHVHGIAVDDVHFHEVGALDSIADIVGTCAAFADLGVSDIVASPIAVGSGVVATEHGELPVPVPAVVELARRWTVFSGGAGELATPTGVALVTTLAAASAPLPAMRVGRVGMGAGSRDVPGRANVVRVVLGEPATTHAEAQADAAVVLEANVDDVDPRLWPHVLEVLLSAGASDAWLTPIVMKKGRPAHTLHVLAPADQAATMRQLVLEHTSTMGLREFTVRKYALPRSWMPVEVEGGVVRVKLAYVDRVIVQATPEFDDAAAVANRRGVPVRDVLAQAAIAAERLGLVRGGAVPERG